ncbi:MAG: hypothetical protein AAF581_10390 [Planctomycetota bacterium]
MIREWRRRPPLPRSFKRHSCYGAVALAAAIITSLASPDTNDGLKALASVVGAAASVVVTIYFTYYVLVYPILHAAKRYEGRNQTTWLVWLVLETAGLGFPIVRALYLFLVLAPDVRATKAASV